MDNHYVDVDSWINCNKYLCERGRKQASTEFWSFLLSVFISFTLSIYIKIKIFIDFKNIQCGYDGDWLDDPCSYIYVIIFNKDSGRVMASDMPSSTQSVNSFSQEPSANFVKIRSSVTNFTSPVKVNSNVMTLQQSQQNALNPQFSQTPVAQSYPQGTKSSSANVDLSVNISKSAISQPLLITSLAGTVSVGESTAQQFIVSTGSQAQTSFISQPPQMVQLLTGNVLAGSNIQIQQHHQQSALQITPAQQQIRGCSQPLRFAITAGVPSQAVPIIQPHVVQRGQLNQGTVLTPSQSGAPPLSPGNPYNGMHPRGTVLSVPNNQGQTVFINSVPAVARPILPKSVASPEKQRVLVPLTLTAASVVRPIAPRTTVAANVNQIKLQPQLFPKVNSSQLLVQSSQTQHNVLNPGTTGVPAFVRVVTPQIVPYFTQVRPRLPSTSPVQAGFGDSDVPSSPTSDLTETKAPKKPCNCTKSQCLKLYCDCFANGEFCSDCNCQNCANNIEHEVIRSKAIKACLDRNPHAFHPKIGKGRGVSERRHTKGCHCKRSGCLKNYCECYEAKILCSTLCKCTGCKNFEESPERKNLMHLADAAEVRFLQQNAAKTKLELQMENLQSRPVSSGSDRLPFSFITGDVAKATSDCLLSRAEKLQLLDDVSEEAAEKAIIEEFGRCISQIIHTSSKTRGYMT